MSLEAAYLLFGFDLPKLITIKFTFFVRCMYRSFSISKGKRQLPASKPVRKWWTTKDIPWWIFILILPRVLNSGRLNWIGQGEEQIHKSCRQTVRNRISWAWYAYFPPKYHSMKHWSILPSWITIWSFFIILIVSIKRAKVWNYILELVIYQVNLSDIFLMHSEMFKH